VFTFCSNNVSEVLGYSSEEMVGKNLFDFMPPEEAKKAKAIFSQVCDQKTSVKNLETWNFRKDGDKVCMVMSGVPFFDDEGILIGYRGIDIDITEQKRSEEKVQELETELTDLRNQITDLLNEPRNNKTKQKGKRKPKNVAPSKKLEEKWSEHEFDSVFIFDENANILDCNENMYKKLGYTKGEMLSLNVMDFDALESKEDILDKIHNVKKAGSLSFKTIHKRKDGSAVLVYESMLYLKDKNMFKCIVRQD